jgi:hypothetical protein
LSCKGFERKRLWCNVNVIRGFAQRNGGKPRKLRMTGVPAEIGTEHLPNKRERERESLERYPYANTLDVSQFRSFPEVVYTDRSLSWFASVPLGKCRDSVSSWVKTVYHQSSYHLMLCGEVSKCGAE